jgi:transcriptional regulator with XRE-family HTH domain
METDAQELAVSLKTYRLRQGLSLPKLGDLWGVSRYSLMRIEAGKHVSWMMMYKVANQLIKAIQNDEGIYLARRHASGCLWTLLLVEADN